MMRQVRQISNHLRNKSYSPFSLCSFSNYSPSTTKPSFFTTLYSYGINTTPHSSYNAHSCLSSRYYSSSQPSSPVSSEEGTKELVNFGGFSSNDKVLEVNYSTKNSSLAIHLTPRVQSFTEINYNLQDDDGSFVLPYPDNSFDMVV